MAGVGSSDSPDSYRFRADIEWHVVELELGQEHSTLMFARLKVGLCNSARSADFECNSVRAIVTQNQNCVLLTSVQSTEAGMGVLCLFDSLANLLA